MAIVFKNNAKTTLNGSITNVATSVTVSDASVFPAVTARVAVSAPVQGAGQYYSTTKALLHGDGTNGGTTFTNSIDAVNWTLGGGGGYTTSTTSPKFGTASISTSTASGYLYQNNTGFNPGASGDFSFDFWINPTHTGSLRETIGFSDGGGTDMAAILVAGYSSGIRLRCRNGGTTFESSSVGTLLGSGNWNHIAVERYNSRYYAWLNGTRVLNAENPSGTGADPDNLPYAFMGQFFGTYSGFTGKIDELYYTTRARYQGAASITVPTEAYSYDYYLDPTQSSSTNSTTAGNYFYATISDGTNREVVKVTNISGNVLTVERGQDGTSGTAFNSGTAIELRPTNQGLLDNRAEAFVQSYALQHNNYLGAS